MATIFVPGIDVTAYLCHGHLDLFASLDDAVRVIMATTSTTFFYAASVRYATFT
jgi:hypothetical protein